MHFLDFPAPTYPLESHFAILITFKIMFEKSSLVPLALGMLRCLLRENNCCLSEHVIVKALVKDCALVNYMLG